MTKETILEQCFRDLMEVHSADFSQTPEGKLQAQREAHLMEYLETCLNRDGQQVVREVLDEMNSFSAREKKLLYEQGILDCVFLLKQLNIIA